jgi:hypothetical protein
MKNGVRESSKIFDVPLDMKTEGRRGRRSRKRAVENDKSHSNEVSTNLRAARSIWGSLPRRVLQTLKELTKKHHLSVAEGDVTMLGDKLYVTHGGLLRIGERSRCSGIVTLLQKDLSDPTASRWVFKATVYRTANSKGFVGYGDADPSNTSSLVRGAELRVAETRAVNRALRKAYGIGLCSVEELGYLSSPPEPVRDKGTGSSHSNGNGSGNGQPRLRDRLCLLIRHHQLDPSLVKRYAADFCGTQEIREASRESVESFIAHLSEWAVKDRSGLLCKLNGYAAPQEVRS